MSIQNSQKALLDYYRLLFTQYWKYKRTPTEFDCLSNTSPFTKYNTVILIYFLSTKLQTGILRGQRSGLNVLIFFFFIFSMQILHLNREYPVSWRFYLCASLPEEKKKWCVIWGHHFFSACQFHFSSCSLLCLSVCLSLSVSLCLVCLSLCLLSICLFVSLSLPLSLSVRVCMRSRARAWVCSVCL